MYNVNVTILNFFQFLSGRKVVEIITWNASWPKIPEIVKLKKKYGIWPGSEILQEVKESQTRADVYFTAVKYQLLSAFLRHEMSGAEPPLKKARLDPVTIRKTLSGSQVWKFLLALSKK